MHTLPIPCEQLSTRSTSWPARQEGSLDFVTPAWTNYADGFESFLIDHFPLPDQAPAVEQLARQTDTLPDALTLPPKGKRSAKATASKEQSTPPRPRPLTREQRRRLHNRAAQQLWRERQKVRNTFTSYR